MTVRVNWKKVSIAFISVVMVALVILGTSITAFAAGGGGAGSSWGTDGYAYGDPSWIGHGVRVYPTPLTEETGDAGIFKNRADRCRDEQWAMYYSIPPYTGGVTPAASLQARSGELKLYDIASQVRTLNTGGSNVFLDWLSRGVSVDGIGAELNNIFFNEIVPNPDKYSAFWSGYELELKRSNNDAITQGQIELWREEIAAGKLGMVVEITTVFNLPVNGGYIATAITTMDFLWIHDKTVGGQYVIEGQVGVNTEQKYIKSVPNYSIALGCYGSGSADGQCTNTVCASMGHLRFALGMPVVAVAPRAFPYPKDNDYAAIARETYWGWGYYQFGEILSPKIKLIETHIYKMDGIEVDREVVANESYPDKPTFVGTPSPRGSCRVTTETKSKHGQTYQFIGYKYTTYKRDPVTDNEINPEIDSGTSSDPNICINTGVMTNEDPYTIYVEAEFNCEPEYIDSDPQPNVIEEWELSKFFQNFPMFRSDGQYLRSSIRTDAGIHYVCTGHRVSNGRGGYRTEYCSQAQATSGSIASGLTYTWNRVPNGMEIVKGGSEGYTWKTLAMSASRLGIQTQIDVRPSAQRGYGHSDDDRNSLWVSKTRIGELIHMAKWKNSVPSALSGYFDSDNFPKTGTVPNYKMPNAGSRLKNSSDSISANNTSAAADSWARNQVTGSHGCTSYVESYTFYGAAVNYTPVTISYRRFNPRTNEETAIPQSAEMYVESPSGTSYINSLWFTTQLPRTLSRSSFGSSYRNTLENRPVLRIHTEVDMTYDDRGTVEPSPTTSALEGNRDDVIVVGDIPRYIRPVSYHGIEINTNRNPKVSSSTVATDSRAIALANSFTNWGNLHRPIIYSGGDLNIGIDQRSLVTVTSWVLDFSNSTVKSDWGNDFWSAEDIHKRYKEGIDFQTNAKVNINNKEMKLIDDNRFNLGGSRATVVSSNKREYNITINGHSWSSSPALPTNIGDKLQLDALVQVFADHEGRTYPTNLNHNIDGGRGWYTEDSTVLKVVWIEETLTLPNVMYSEKIPITLGPPTPSNYNQLFSNGYIGRIDWEFVLNTVGTSLSPFSPDGGGITLVPYNRMGSGMTEFVVADANVLDARQGGRN